MGEFSSEVRARHERDGCTTSGCTTPPLTGLELAFEFTADGVAVLRIGEGLIEYLLDKVE